MKKGATIIMLIVTIIVALAVGILFAAHLVTNGDTVLNNIYVGGIPLEGLNRIEAKAALEDAGWDDNVSQPLKVTTLGGVSFEVDPLSSGLVLTVDEAVEAAFEHGHGSRMLENLSTFIKLFASPVDVNETDTAANVEYIDSCIAQGMEALDVYMGTEEYVVDYEGEALKMIKGWGQIEMDAVAFRDAVIYAIKAGEKELSYTQISSQPVSPDFAGLFDQLNCESVDASYSDDGKFEVSDEVIGCSFDVNQAQQMWNDAAAGDAIAIPLDVDWPAVTGDELRDRLFHDLLGAVTTKFPNSAAPRRNNLELATSKIDGMIMYPGDVFSYNEVVGERTEEAGFLPAPAYVDGDVEDEIGGGACQVSSTLYAATAFAFLETVERECHYFPVNYMQMGTDATVTIPAGGGRTIDFKFKNNKNYPIKLVGIFDNENSTLTFEVWGTLEEDDYMPIEFNNTYTWQFDYDRWIDPAYEDREAYCIQLKCEIWSFEDDVGPGYRTLTHRIVTDTEGNVVLDEIINKKLDNDNYAMDTYYQH